MRDPEADVTRQWCAPLELGVYRFVEVSYSPLCRRELGPGKAALCAHVGAAGDIGLCAVAAELFVEDECASGVVSVAQCFGENYRIFQS